MHLVDVIALRPIPAAGLIIEVTRRCPMSCDHCVTSSTMAVQEHSEVPALRLLESFSADDRPEVIALTGGEPLLRPHLVKALAERAHRVGTKVHLLTGMFFARSRAVPAPIDQALNSLDHVSVSLDAYHEREVPRAAVFAILKQLIREGIQVSCQTVAATAEDPYVVQLVDDVRTTFEDQVPILVSALHPVGRAADLPLQDGRPGHTSAQSDGLAPCTMAAWPVLCADGRVVACCNHKVVEGVDAPHLQLNQTAGEDWKTLRQRCQGDLALQAIRSCGPNFLAQTLGRPQNGGYCDNCHSLGNPEPLADGLREVVRSPLMRMVEASVTQAKSAAGAQAFIRQHGVPEFASLVSLGYPEVAGA
ncbi:radical SAM protein [Streptomyces sp. NPDC056601]|uniref:radical SAM protein n=1 Tax=Streptomyces sp. NPDC056601 TaxID=3345875 RepID=UPI00368E58A0